MIITKKLFKIVTLKGNLIKTSWKSSLHTSKAGKTLRRHKEINQFLLVQIRMQLVVSAHCQIIYT